MWNIEATIARVGVPLEIVDAATVGRPLEFACHGSAIAFSPDGKHLVSGGEHGNLNLWKRTSVDSWSHITMDNGILELQGMVFDLFGPRLWLILIVIGH